MIEEYGVSNPGGREHHSGDQRGGSRVPDKRYSIIIRKLGFFRDMGQTLRS